MEPNILIYIYFFLANSFNSGECESSFDNDEGVTTHMENMSGRSQISLCSSTTQHESATTGFYNFVSIYI